MTNVLARHLAGFLLGLFFGGESIVMQISFVMLIFLLFLDQISGRQKSLREKLAQGVPPVEESQLSSVQEKSLCRAYGMAPGVPQDP